MAAIGRYYLVPPMDWFFSSRGNVREGQRRAEDYRRTHPNYEGAECQIEEFVRQWVLAQLITVYNYPRHWLGERILIEEPVQMGSSQKAADVSIKTANHRTFLYVETKSRGIPDNEFNAAERQLETYLASTHTATIGMVTDGERVKTIRKKIRPGWPPERGGWALSGALSPRKTNRKVIVREQKHL